MAKVKLDFETDFSELNQGLQNGQKIIDQAGVSVKKFGTESKAAWLKSFNEVHGFSDEVKKGTKEIENMSKGVKALGAGAQRLRDLKKEIKELTGESIRLRQQGDLIGADAAIKKAGELKDELKDIQDAIGSVAGNARENLAKAFGSATRIGAQGFELAASSAGLFGAETENVQKALLKLQSIQSIARIAGEFGDIGDRIKEIKLGLAPLRETLIKSFNDPIGAVKTLYAVIRANPIATFLAVVSALGVAFLALKDKLNLFGEAEKKTMEDSIKNSERVLELLEKEIEFRNQLLEAQGKNTIKFQKEATDAQLNFIIQQLAALSDYRNKFGELSEEQQQTQINLENEYEKLVRQRTISQTTLLRDREKNIADHQKNLRESEINFIKDDQKREIENAKFKKEQELQAFQQSLVLLYTEEEQRVILSEVRKQKQEELEKEVAQINDKYYKIRLAAEKDFQEAMFQLGQKIEAATAEETIQKQQEAALHELEILKQSIIKKGEAVDAGFKLNAEQLQQFQILEKQIYQHTTQELIKLEVERQNKIASARLQTAQANLFTLDTLEKSDIEAVNGIARPGGFSEVDFEETKQLAILDIQRKYAEERIKLQRTELTLKREEALKQLDGELAIIQNKEDEQSNLEREAIRERLRTTEEGFDAQNQLLENAFKAQLSEIEAQKSKIQGEDFDLAKLLHLTPEEYQQLANSISQITQATNQFISAAVSASEEEARIAKEKGDIYSKQISDLESKLQNELVLNAKGLTNSSTAIRNEIDALKQQKQEQALIEEEAAAKSAEIKRQQIILNGALAVTETIVASAKIFASLGSAGPAGVVVAIGAIATMIATIAGVAAQLKEIQGFSEGVIDLQGPGTSKSDSINARLSKGESVMTAEETKSNKNLFKGIRTKNKPLIQEGIFNLLANTGVTLPAELPKKLTGKKQQIQNAVIGNLISDYSELESKLQSTNEKLDMLIKLNGQKEFSHNGALYVKRGNNTTIRK